MIAREPWFSPRRLRLRLGNVPILSLLSYRWMVIQGSVIYDLALTRRAALRRRPSIGRAIQIVPVRSLNWPRRRKSTHSHSNPTERTSA